VLPLSCLIDAFACVSKSRRIPVGMAEAMQALASKTQDRILKQR
jgi:hypothetical protein